MDDIRVIDSRYVTPDGYGRSEYAVQFGGEWLYMADDSKARELSESGWTVARVDFTN